jgi:transcription initiation factor TFIID subunit 5
LFVYSYLNLVADCFPRESQKFFNTYKDIFTRTHESDIRVLSTLSLPEHVSSNNIAQIYRTNKYRVTLSPQAYYNLIQFLEAKDKDGGTVVLSILQHYCNIRTAERGGASGSSISLIGAALGQGLKDEDVLAEDEGIPGHNPGSANTTASSSNVLVKLRLGPLPMDPDLIIDVQNEAQDQDVKNPPDDGQNTLAQEFEAHIKREQSDDTPAREDLPLPPYSARDVAMEVQKIRENRDRFKIEAKTGGAGPGLSVVMFTWHNTYDRSVLQYPEPSQNEVLMKLGIASIVWTSLKTTSLRQLVRASPIFVSGPWKAKHSRLFSLRALIPLLLPPVA